MGGYYFCEGVMGGGLFITVMGGFVGGQSELLPLNESVKISLRKKKYNLNKNNLYIIWCFIWALPRGLR